MKYLLSILAITLVVITFNLNAKEDDSSEEKGSVKELFQREEIKRLKIQLFLSQSENGVLVREANVHRANFKHTLDALNYMIDGEHSNAYSMMADVYESKYFEREALDTMVRILNPEQHNKLTEYDCGSDSTPEVTAALRKRCEKEYARHRSNYDKMNGRFGKK